MSTAGYVRTSTFATMIVALLLQPNLASQARLPDVGLELGRDVNLVAGQKATLRDPDIVVTLIEARGPREGCFDCPLNARLTVESGGERVELRYMFSGNMPPEALDRAKRKTAFGRVFVAVRISNTGLTLRVENPKPA